MLFADKATQELWPRRSLTRGFGSIDTRPPGANEHSHVGLS